MTGSCYIDDVDVYTQYGVLIANGYDGLLAFPALKEPDKNDWAEEHGVEVDLSNPLLQAQEITVDFAIANNNQLEAFFAFLTTSGEREIYIPALGKTWSLRVTGMSELERYTGADIFSISFMEDMPVIPSGYPAANGSGLLVSVISIDGKTLDKYGIIVTSGIDDLVQKPNLKKALTRTNSLMSGQLYDSNFVRFSEKEVVFGCCLSAAQIAGFWNLYNALFGDLLKSGTRTISYQGKNYSGYYKSTGNWQLHSHAGPVVCEFELTMSIIKEL